MRTCTCTSAIAQTLNENAGYGTVLCNDCNLIDQPETCRDNPNSTKHKAQSAQRGWREATLHNGMTSSLIAAMTTSWKLNILLTDLDPAHQCTSELAMYRIQHP